MSQLRPNINFYAKFLSGISPEWLLYLSTSGDLCFKTVQICQSIFHLLRSFWLRPTRLGHHRRAVHVSLMTSQSRNEHPYSRSTLLQHRTTLQWQLLQQRQLIRQVLVNSLPPTGTLQRACDFNPHVVLARGPGLSFSPAGSSRVIPARKLTAALQTHMRTFSSDTLEFAPWTPKLSATIEECRNLSD